MKIEIKVPALGESVVEATISSIKKPAGSVVKIDEELLELETDKVNQVLYAPQGGLVAWTVSVGDSVKIGQVIGSIDTEAKEAVTPVAKQQAAPPPPPPLPAPRGSSARVMPQQFVKEVTEQGVPPQAQIPVRAPAPATERRKMSSLRKVIATRLVEVKNTTAMLTTFNEVDLSKVMEIRTQEKESFTKKYGVKLGFMSFFVKAVVAALKEFPQVNASIEGDDIVSYSHYDIGVAVSTERGLMVPVIRGCEALSFGQIERALEEYAKKAREGSIAIADLKGGTFTITNGGTFGSLLSTPILNPPQSAILGMHAILKRPVAIDDAIVIRPMMYLALSYDHRLIDGKEAVLFLVHIKKSLEEPSRLLLDL
jgi:2-oxoglutarate dehydrogenase E2 component (dihydrolipoamide succinyltransferase)